MGGSVRSERTGAARLPVAELIAFPRTISPASSGPVRSGPVASQSTKAGTYPVRASASPGGQLDPITTYASAAQSRAPVLNSASDTYTVNGVQRTLEVTFGSGRKAISVKGSWNRGS